MKEQFIETRFRADSIALIDSCEEVIEQYQAQGLRLTLRQLYYQLVSGNIVANTERVYKKIGNLVSRARLAGLLDWDAIEDRIRLPRKQSNWSSPQDIMQAALSSYRLDRWEGQPEKIELWVEKDALAGILDPIAKRHHVTMMVNRGYSSQSAMYDAAQRVHEANNDGIDFHILYLGDLDPSGEDMVRDIDERLNLTFDAACTIHKLAITPAQVDEYQPPPNPAKLSDSRAKKYIAKHGYSSYEVDALPPDALQTIINEAITAFIETDALGQVLDQEDVDKRLMRRAMETIMEERA